MVYDSEYPVIPFRIEKAYRFALQELAIKNETSMNGLICHIIKSYLKDNGIAFENPKFHIKKVML